MRPTVPLALALVLALVLAVAGCGATPSSAGDFQGEERRVAEAIEEVQSAGQSNEPQRLCDELFAEALVQRLQAGGANCRAELGAALDDVDDFELEVRDVTVQGTRATARVEGENGALTLTLVREGGRWRVSEFGG